MLLDTTFSIDPMRGDDEAVEKAKRIETELRQQRISSMTLFELYYGATRSDRRERERKNVEGGAGDETGSPRRYGRREKGGTEIG